MTKHYEQRKAANERYLAKFASIMIRVKPEEKEKITVYAAANGESVNAFILRAIDETMQNDKTKTTPD